MPVCELRAESWLAGLQEMGCTLGLSGAVPTPQMLVLEIFRMYTLGSEIFKLTIIYNYLIIFLR